MGQALYRKYRSKKLSEIVGQEHITKTLTNALESGKLSHAYLLTGPRGTGKTSIARILAHEINGLSYDDAAHLDIIEIDAASNRRIDEIRDLRDKVNTAPAQATYKVYIIDEVHMLTKEAFNALLKTLEEPPAHVIFILATTEAHKLPETIISRTQRYSFRPVAKTQVMAHLRSIAQAETIQIDDAALELIAEHGEGSFRDSISLLDQASSLGKHVAREDIEHILGLAPATYIEQIVQALAANTVSSLVDTLQDIYAQGYEPAMIAVQLGARLREDILYNPEETTPRTIKLLRQLLDVPAARDAKQLLEITLIGAVLADTATPHVQPRVTAVQPSVKSTPVLAQAKQLNAAPLPAPIALEPAAVIESKEQIPEPTAHDIVGTDDVSELWQQTLEAIKKQYNTLYGIARMASPSLVGNTLTLTLKFAFHQKRLNEAKNRKIIIDVMERLSGKPLEIVCVVAATPTDSTLAKPDVSAISNIFGGAELLES